MKCVPILTRKDIFELVRLALATYIVVNRGVPPDEAVKTVNSIGYEMLRLE